MENETNKIQDFNESKDPKNDEEITSMINISAKENEETLKKYLENFKNLQCFDLMTESLFCNMLQMTAGALSALEETLDIYRNSGDFIERSLSPYYNPLCDPSTIWKAAHMYEGGHVPFAQLTIRIVTIGTSESNEERFLSQQQWRLDCRLKGTKSF